ncbi:MAG TPA: hypothetical protein VF522_01750 [Ramlibacter sp.]|uniref:hypothetical protein n=1 Tax=Ramlibacter sp. TaxID=1917967 RepID=UPI002ED01397
MSAGVQTQVAARRAALTIHALGEEDRAWMLAQLQPQQRAVLEPLLSELRDLGIQSDRRVLEQIESDSPSPVSATARLARLGRPQIQHLARLLEQEPPEVTRALLAAGDAAWRNSLLKALDPRFATRVRGLSSAVSNGPALAAALLAVVEGRLNRQAGGTARSSWWSAWNVLRRTA